MQEVEKNILRRLKVLETEMSKVWKAIQEIKEVLDIIWADDYELESKRMVDRM